MRHRLVCPLYDQHPKHLEVLNHLDRFAKTDRGRELATLAVAGYAALYGRGETAPKSLDSDLGDLLRQLMSNGAQEGGEGASIQGRPVHPAKPGSVPAPKPEVPEAPPGPKAAEANNPPAQAPVKSEPAPEARPTPPQDPTPPQKKGLEDEAPSPEDDEDHVDALSLIGSQFG